MKNTLKYFAPPLFLILALIDAHITMIAANIFSGALRAISTLIILALMLACMKFSKRYLIITSLVIGLVLDSYFIGIIGINGLILPVLVYFMYQFKEVLNANIFTELFGLIIFVTADAVLLAALQAIFQLANVDPIWFVASLLGPSLLLNILIFFIVIVPLRKLFQVK